MSRMLSKMNLISVVQQLPKEDIETIQGYVEMIEKENQQLKTDLEMYENGVYFSSENDKLQNEIDNLNHIIDKQDKDITILSKGNKHLKEVIDKAINNSQYWIDYYTRLNSDERIALRLQENIDILKEAE